MTVPLVRPGGEVVALKGSRAEVEIEESKPLMKKLKLKSFEIVMTGENLLAEPTRVVRTRLV
jgi:16S rRNA (guanine527-N7)-methyltransferase